MPWVVSAGGSLERGQECGESLRFGRGVGIAGPHRGEDAVDLTVEDGPGGFVLGLQGRLVVVPCGFEVFDPGRCPRLVAGPHLRERVLSDGAELRDLRGREISGRRLPWGECRGDGRPARFILAGRRGCVGLPGSPHQQGARGYSDNGVVPEHDLLAGRNRGYGPLAV